MRAYRQVGYVVFVNVKDFKALVVPSYYHTNDNHDPGHLCHDILSTTPPAIVGLFKMKEHHVKPSYKDATAKFDSRQHKTDKLLPEQASIAIVSTQVKWRWADRCMLFSWWS